MDQRGSAALTLRTDLGGGAEGYLVVDTSYQNSSSGGLRAGEDLTIEEIATLAREMSLKYAFIGRRSGGAKSGIRLAPGTTPSEKRRVFAEFGRRLGPILRRSIYSCGTDINCGVEDLKVLYGAAGIHYAPTTDTSVFTAMGAAEAIAACREAIGRPRTRLRVALEGFGNVAGWLARRLPADEYVIVAVSTVDGTVLNERGLDPQELVAQRDRHGPALVRHVEGTHGGRETVFSADVDVFVPGARTWTLGADRARGLRARFVVPVANAPYGDGAVELLEGRGLVVLPGIVSNCGGVFASALYDRGVPLARVERICRERFRPVVAALLEARERHGASPVALAHRVAEERLAAQVAGEVHEPTARRIARTLAREHLPRRLVGLSYARRFERNLVELEQLVRTRGRETPAPGLRGTGS